MSIVSLFTFEPPSVVDVPGSDFAQHLVTALELADVRGMGGAHYPAARKLAAACDTAAGPRKPGRLIINACDGEPDAVKDSHLMRVNGRLVAAGAALVARAIAADDVVFAAHAHGVGAASILQEFGLPWRAMAVPERYVSSEAGSLNSLADGGPARPGTKWQPQATLPRPVLVFNAETLARVAVAWAGYASGHKSTPARLVTLAGVPQGGVVEVSNDITFGELLSLRGARQPQALLLGGYGGTWVSWAAVGHLPVTEAAVRPLGASLGAGLVRVLETETCPVQFVAALVTYLAGENAGQCGPCKFGLPAIASDWLALQQPATAQEAYGRLQRRLPVILGRGGCAHPDGVVRMLSSALGVFDAHLANRCGACSGSVAAGATPETYTSATYTPAYQQPQTRLFA